jgi:hypothetical protein
MALMWGGGSVSLTRYLLQQAQLENDVKQHLEVKHSIAGGPVGARITPVILCHF